MKCAVHYVLLSLLLLVALTACTTTAMPTTPTTPVQTVVIPATIGVTSTPTAARSTVPPATAPVAKWIRRQFAKAWDIEYPEGWTASDAGLHEGNLSLRGAYGNHKYEVALGYPIFQRPVAAQSLDAWIEDELAALAPAQRGAIQIGNITVAGAPAKKVLYLPEKIFDDGVTRRYAQQLTHAGYIWRRNDKNPSVIIIKEVGAPPLDAQQMEAVLDRLLAGVR